MLKNIKLLTYLVLYGVASQWPDSYFTLSECLFSFMVPGEVFSRTQLLMGGIDGKYSKEY